MKKLSISVIAILSLTLAIYSCTKETSTTTSTSKNQLKHWGEWNGETRPGKLISALPWTVDCDCIPTPTNICDKICLRYIGNGNDKFIGRAQLATKGMAFTAAIIDNNKIYLKPYLFKDDDTENEFLSQTDYEVKFDEILEGFPLSGANSGKRIKMIRGNYPIQPPLSSDHKAYIEISVEIVD